MLTCVSSDPGPASSPIMQRDHPSAFAAAFDAIGVEQGWALGEAAPAATVGTEQTRRSGRHCPDLLPAEAAPTGLQDTYLWHDYETFGRRPRLDQAAQFAAIRTDGQLQAVATPMSLLCQPNSDSLPSPGACLVHGITAQNCARNGVPEWEFAGLVASAFDTPGTTGIGYNSIDFDAAFTRALRWRNLLPVTPGTQLDLLDILVAVRCLDPDALAWPTRADGSVSLRLVDVCGANGIDAAAAHDALADVSVTLALGRAVHRSNHRLWDVLASRRNPAAVAATVAEATHAGQWLVRLSPWADRTTGSAQILLPVAQGSGRSRHRVAFLDLGTPVDAVQAWLVQGPAGELRSPIEIIDTGCSPMLFRADSTLLDWLVQVWGHDYGPLVAAARSAQARMPVLRAAAAMRLSGTPRTAAADRDQPAGTDPFDPGRPTDVPAADAELLRRWRALAGRPPGFGPVPAQPETPELRKVVELFQARHLPHTLSAARAAQWDVRRAAHIVAMAEAFGYAHLAGGAGGPDRSLIDAVLAHARALGWEPG